MYVILQGVDILLHNTQNVYVMQHSLNCSEIQLHTKSCDHEI